LNLFHPFSFFVSPGRCHWARLYCHFVAGSLDIRYWTFIIESFSSIFIFRIPRALPLG
jgi:hypothetical protein